MNACGVDETDGRGKTSVCVCVYVFVCMIVCLCLCELNVQKIFILLAWLSFPFPLAHKELISLARETSGCLDQEESDSSKLFT